MTKSRFLYGLFALALSAMVFAPAAAQQRKITFLLTSDIYKMSEQNGRGGYARLAGVIKAERARGGKVIVVHAGDAISPCLMCSFDQGEHVIDIMNQLTIDFFVPGNHEFDFGPQIYRRRMSEARFPIYAANLRDAAGQPLTGQKDYEIIDFQGVKIAMIGLTAEDSPQKSNPGDLKIAPVRQSLIDRTRELRAQGADFVVGVVHAERQIDNAIHDLGIADVIMSGDDHDFRYIYNRRTVFMEGGEDASYVMALDITFEDKREPGARIEWKPHFRMIDTADVAPDPEIAGRVRFYEDQLSRELDVELGELVAPLDSRSATVRAGEAAWGNLITDAIREATKADLAIMNGGGIRGGRRYEAGHKLTRRNVLTELPFGNKTLTFRLTGTEVVRTLEHGYAAFPRPAGPFLQISGGKILIDPSRNAGERVVSVEINGAPLERDRYYTIAASDFFLRGGDGFTAFTQQNLRTREEDAQLIANDVMVYARRLGHIDARPEGRVNAR